MGKPMTREEVKKWAKEFVEEFNARQEEIAGCDCDSPTWCQQYGKCHRVSCGFAPAKKEWVSLTDEEIRGFEIWLDEEEEKHGWNPPADIVKYIERALKEKNNG